MAPSVLHSLRSRRARLAGGLVLLSALLSLGACAAREVPPGDRPPDRDTTQLPATQRSLPAEEVFSGESCTPRDGPALLLAADARDLRGVLPEVGEVAAQGNGAGFFVAALAGEKPTGGYAVEISEVLLRGGELRVGVEVSEPPEGAILTQALTYPCAVAFVRGAELPEGGAVVVDAEGRRLGWPVERVAPGGA